MSDEGTTSASAAGKCPPAGHKLKGRTYALGSARGAGLEFLYTMNMPTYEPAAALDFFQAAGEVETIPAGKTIFRENGRGSRVLLQRDKMYLLLTGRVSLLTGAQALRDVKSGEIFGEMGAIANLPRSATAVAKTPCRVIGLDQRQFSRALARKPAFALMLMKVMAKRLREAVARLKSRGGARQTEKRRRNPAPSTPSSWPTCCAGSRRTRRYRSCATR